MDRSSKQKVNKETQVSNDTLDMMDLIDIFRISHPNAFHPNARFNPKNTLSSQVHMEHSPGESTSWVTNQNSKFKKIETVSSSLTPTL